MRRREQDDEEVMVKPAWLEGLMGETFFGGCGVHENRRKNEKNVFCLRCCLSICPHCLPSHSSHPLLQVLFQLIFSSKFGFCASVKLNSFLGCCQILWIFNLLLFFLVWIHASYPQFFGGLMGILWIFYKKTCNSVGFNLLDPLIMWLDIITRQTQKLDSSLSKLWCIS